MAKKIDINIIAEVENSIKQLPSNRTSGWTQGERIITSPARYISPQYPTRARE